MKDPEKFMRLVKKSGQCWKWGGYITKYGYGVCVRGGRWRRAHKVAFELFIGPVPAGLVLDHICRNRWCVYPGHLRAVTIRENNANSEHWGPDKTHCIHGHEYTPENTLIQKNRKTRACKACARKRISEFHKKYGNRKRTAI